MVLRQSRLRQATTCILLPPAPCQGLSQCKVARDTLRQLEQVLQAVDDTQAAVGHQLPYVARVEEAVRIWHHRRAQLMPTLLQRSY